LSNERGLRLIDLRLERAGSSFAMTWPLRTSELKSAYSDWIVPETCVPTWTVVTASTVPVASTAFTTLPRITLAVTGAGPMVPRLDW
jgi:hypothetical protein